MSYIHGLRCRECGETYEEGPIYICEECFGPLEVVYDYQAIGRDVQRRRIADGPFNIWRYQALLPAQSNGVVGSDVGFTPLFHARNLGRALGLERLYIKNDCVTPSYSFKDRVVSIAVTKALEFGFDTIACASTGNRGELGRCPGSAGRPAGGSVRAGRSGGGQDCCFVGVWPNGDGCGR